MLALGATSLSPPAATSTEEALSAYEQARSKFAAGDIEAAVIELKNALQSNPDYLPAHLLLVQVYLKQGLGESAEKELARATELGADPSLTTELLAETYLQQGRYEHLLATIDPDAFDLTVRQKLLVPVGYARLALGQVEPAREAFLTSAALSPSDPRPHIGLARAALALGNTQAAAREVDLATGLAPDDAAAWNLKASISHALGNLTAAAVEYGRVIELEPKHIDARIARAAVFIDAGEDEQANADIDYLRTEFPFEPRAAYLRSVLLRRANHEAEARDMLVETTNIIKSLDPEALKQSSQHLLLAGLAFYDLGEHQQAVEYLTQCLERAPELVGARKVLGAAYLALDQPASALEALQPALEASPNDHRLLVLLATAHMRLGQHREATPLLEQALAASGGNAGIRTELAISRLAGGQEDRAMEELSVISRDDPDERRAGMLLAIMQARRGEQAEAVQTAKALSDRDPTNVTLLSLLGATQVAAGEPVEARLTFEKAIELEPGFLTAQMHLARLDGQEGKLDEAKERLLALVDAHPGNARVLLALSQLEEASGNIDEAVRWLEKARGNDAKALAPALALAELHLRSQNPKLALGAAEEAEQIAPDAPAVLAVLGRAHLALGEEEEALAIFDRLVELAGYDAEALFQIAGYQLAADAFDAAIATLEKAVQGDPGFMPAQIALVEAQLRAGRSEAARARADELRGKLPESAIGYRLLGDVEAQQGEHEEALESYRIAFEREPSQMLALRLYRAHLSLGDDESARRVLEQWVESHPEDLVGRSALAEQHLRMGSLDDARKHYELVHGELPDQPYVLNNLAFIYARQGDPRALEYAEHANRLAPQDPMINDTLGWILVQSGDAARGLTYLREAQSRAATNPEIRYHIAVALARLDRPIEAKAELVQALEAGQPFEGIEQARDLLNELE